jgi:hypothetical protein
MGGRGPCAGHDGQHVQAASHHQGSGEEEEDREDEPHSGHPVHGLLAPISCLLLTHLLSTRYASLYPQLCSCRNTFLSNNIGGKEFNLVDNFQENF